MRFEVGTKNNIKEIMDIINDSKKRLKQSGINQWQDGYPNEEVFINDCNNKECYVCYDKDTLCGVFVLSFRPDPTYRKIYEGNWGGEGYGALHRVAVHSKYLSQGIGSKLIEYAKQVCQQKNISWLRVDTHEENKTMKRLLEKNGFTYRGTIYLEDNSKRNAYDCNVYKE